MRASTANMFNLTLLSNIISAAVAGPLGSVFPHGQAAPQVCNGHAEFCNRSYSNVTLIGTHNAPFVGPLVDPRYNQNESVQDQLAAGIRYMTAQTHLSIPNDRSSTIDLCHTTCIELDVGPLSTFLATVKTFLDTHPSEVVTVLIVNGDYLPVTLFAPVYEALNLTALSFVPATSPAPLPIGAWPTYAELIAAGTRLITFMDYDANETAVPYILDEFAYYFETPYDTLNASFPECSINRPPGASAAGRMYLVNHDLDKTLIPGIVIPDNAADYTTNAATGNGSIGAQAELCVGLYGREPNVVLVDQFNRGNVFVAQDNLNGLSSATNATNATASTRAQLAKSKSAKLTSRRRWS